MGFLPGFYSFLHTTMHIIDSQYRSLYDNKNMSLLPTADIYFGFYNGGFNWSIIVGFAFQYLGQRQYGFLQLVQICTLNSTVITSTCNSSTTSHQSLQSDDLSRQCWQINNMHGVHEWVGAWRLEFPATRHVLCPSQIYARPARAGYLYKKLTDEF